MDPTDWVLVVLVGWVIVATVIAMALSVVETRRQKGPDVDEVVASEVETLDDEWAAADREDMTWLWPKQ